MFSKNGIITLEGLRELFEMKEEGKPPPKGWGSRVIYRNSNRP